MTKRDCKCGNCKVRDEQEFQAIVAGFNEAAPAKPEPTTGQIETFSMLINMCAEKAEMNCLTELVGHIDEFGDMFVTLREDGGVPMSAIFDTDGKMEGNWF